MLRTRAPGFSLCCWGFRVRVATSQIQRKLACLSTVCDMGTLYGHVPKRLACNRVLGPHPLHTPLHRVCNRGRFSRHTQSFVSCGRYEGCATRGMVTGWRFKGYVTEGLWRGTRQPPLAVHPHMCILSAIMLLGIVRPSLQASRCKPLGAEVLRKQFWFICGSTGCLGWLFFKEGGQCGKLMPKDLTFSACSCTAHSGREESGLIMLH